LTQFEPKGRCGSSPAQPAVQYNDDWGVRPASLVIQDKKLLAVGAYGVFVRQDIPAGTSMGVRTWKQRLRVDITAIMSPWVKRKTVLPVAPPAGCTAILETLICPVAGGSGCR
jgi:hypothetical protein